MERPAPRPAAGSGGARPALLCLPHAGGSAAPYGAWKAALAPLAEVVPVELPGRGARYDEPPARGVDELVAAVHPALDQHAGRGVLLYGHSLGALLAYEAAHRLTAAGHPPLALAVSGRNGPSRPAELRGVFRLPDAELFRRLGGLAGTPAEVLADPELMSLLLPPLRADLEAAETYRYRARPPLDCPLVVLQGRDDPLVDPDGARAWRAETTGPVDVSWHDGGHFFQQRPEFAATVLRPRLAAALAAAGRVPGDRAAG